MPKGSQQTRSDIIVCLKENRRGGGRTDLITPEELELAMSKAGISAPGPVRNYIKNLVDLGYLVRTGGGFRLSAESRGSTVIRATVSPTQNTDEVLRAVRKAVQRFGDVVVLELVK